MQPNDPVFEPNDAESRVDEFTAILAEFDDALASRRESTPALESSTPVELALRVRLAEAVLRRVENRWPRGGTAEFYRWLNNFRPNDSLPVADRLPTLGRFEILRELGRGGSGVVFLARDPILGREVAVKVPKAEALLSPEHRERFTREARAAARLDHPNLVSVHEAGEIGLSCFIVSEYCPGPTLSTWIKRDGPLPVREAAGLVAALAAAVHYMHNVGILHRDIKPSNVLLVPRDNESARGPETDEFKDPSTAANAESHSSATSRKSSQSQSVSDFTPKLTDFGLARLLDADVDRTHTGIVMGTPSYMSPEQAEGRVRDIGPCTDVYGLGSILYALVTGKPPFRGATNAETYLKVVSSEPVLPRRLRPGVPDDLEAICLKCLEKQPNARYSSADELAKDLKRFLRGAPTLARPISRIRRSGRWCKRNPVIAALGTAVLLLLVGFAVAGPLVAVNQSMLRLEADNAATLASDAAHRAEGAAVAENTTRRRTRRQLYVAHMNLAQAAWETADIARALDLLKQYLPDPQEEDLRCFEWYYWWRACHAWSASLDHTGRPTCVTFSPDGASLATSAADTVRIWDVANGELKGYYRQPNAYRVRSLMYSPDGNTLAFAVDDAIRIQDTATGELVAELNADQNAVLSVAFSPDGLILASAGNDGTVKLWSVSSGRMRNTLECHDGAVSSVAFSPDGQFFATGGLNRWDHTVRIWETHSGDLTATLQGHEYGVADVAYSPDGKILVSASEDYQLRAWDTESHRHFLTLGDTRNTWISKSRHTNLGHLGRVSSVSYSPDGKTLASGSADRTIRLWNGSTGRLDQVLKGHTEGVECLAFSPDGSLLATGSLDGTVKLWNLAKGIGPETLKGHGAGTVSLAFTPDSQTLMSSSHDIISWNLDSKESNVEIKEVEPDPILPGPNWCWDSTFSHGLQLFATGYGHAKSHDRRLRIWDLTKHTQLPTLSFRELAALAFSPDDKVLASVSYDGKVKLWDVATGNQTVTFDVYANSNFDIAFSPDGATLAVASGDNTVRMWDVSAGQQRGQLQGHSQPISSLAFTADSALLATGSFDRSVRLWQPDTGELVAILAGHDGPVNSIAFTSRGRTLAAGTGHGTVRLWNLLTREPTTIIQADSDSVKIVLFSPDDKVLATAGRDQTIKLWRAATDEEVAATAK